jgi:lipid II:glycine glycyltransferase (peptidoglycan interpeptide bridge formation enzyme)
MIEQVHMSPKSLPLENGHTSEVNTVDKKKWQEILCLFSDSNIYQTWSYDAIRCGETNISHVIVRSAHEIVAAAQARIVRLPLIGLGAAYVRWGPFWQLRGRSAEQAFFRSALRALRNEYVCRQGLILRIFPLLYNNDSDPYKNILLEEGYRAIPAENPGRTLIMDISPAIDDLRKKLDQKWRNCLNKAEKSNLEIIDGTDDSFFTEFIKLYCELLQRKKFQEPNDINEFKMIQRDLPPECKMRIFLSRSEAGISAGAICAAVGETGIYLFGAINDIGMQNKSSYLLQWRAIQWLKDRGCRYYNLNGINPLKNQGTYHFKAGLSARNGMDICYLGRFDCYPGKLHAMMAHTANSMIPFVTKVKSLPMFSSKLSGGRN